MLGLIHLINEEEDVVFESRPFFYWHFSQMLYAISLFFALRNDRFIEPLYFESLIAAFMF